MTERATPLWEDEETLWARYAEKIGWPSPSADNGFPDFFVIAPPKTGTTWLFENLRRHPQVFVPPEKEVRYFDLHWRTQNIDWYCQRFARTEGRVFGDLSPSYSLLPSFAIKTIQSLKPDLKIVFLIREPVARAWSHTKHTFIYHEANFRGGNGAFDRVSDSELLANFTHDLIISSGDYEEILKRWLRHFPKQQFHVAFFEDTVKYPERYFRSLCAFLGIDDQIELDNFPLGKKVLEGLPHKLPAKAGRVLESLYSKRRLALLSFLSGTFGLISPWAPPTEIDELSPIWLLELSTGWKIYLYGGSFFALDSKSSSDAAETAAILTKGKDDLPKAEFLGDLLKRVSSEKSQRSSRFSLAMRVSRKYADWVGKSSNRSGRFSTEDRRLVRLLNELFYSYKNRVTVEFVEDSRDFNIVKVREKFLALAKSLGPTRPMGELLGERELAPLVITGATLEEVRSNACKIEEESHPLVELVGDTTNFNLLKIKGKFLAVAKSLGPTALMVERLGERELVPVVFVRDSLEEVREKAIECEQEATPPDVELIDEMGEYNMVKAGDRFIAIAKNLGPINLFREHFGERELPPFIFIATDLAMLRSRILNAASDPNPKTRPSS